MNCIQKLMTLAKHLHDVYPNVHLVRIRSVIRTSDNIWFHQGMIL